LNSNCFALGAAGGNALGQCLINYEKYETNLQLALDVSK